MIINVGEYKDMYITYTSIDINIKQHKLKFLLSVPKMKRFKVVNFYYNEYKQPSFNT